MFDILQAIDLIEIFTIDTKSYYQFSNDLKTQSAVERQIGIIGEAVNKLEKQTPQVRVDNGGKIIAMRNRIIHSYDNIDPTVTWAIVKKHLIPLKLEITALLNL